MKFWWAWAGRHLALGDVERAGQLYEMAVALEPNNPSLQVGLGIFHLKFNRYGEAETAFRKALDMDSSYVLPGET